MPNIGLRLTIEVAEDTTTPMFQHFEDRLVEVLGLYDEWYSAFRKIEARRFTKEGPGWAPLAAPTVAQRKAMGIGGTSPILNRSGVDYAGRKGGQLRKSLTTKGAKNAVVEPLPDGLFVGTKDPVAIFHQGGTHGAGVDHNVSMPARPIVDLSEEDSLVFASIAEEWIYGSATGELFSAEADTPTLQVMGL
jgi:phage gpG-like protein